MNHPALEGKAACITGSARGIGKNIARLFGKEGAFVAIADMSRENGEATVAEFEKIGIHAAFFHCNLAERGAPQELVRHVAKKFGKLDILVNNARSGTRAGLLDESEDSWETGMSVTLKAAFFASQEAIRLMSLSGGGAILNVSSIAAQLVSPESPVYHMAKAGIVQMSRYLAVNAGPLNIRVNAILPGFIVQDEHRQKYDGPDNRAYRGLSEAMHPLGRTGGSDEIARAALYLCSSDSSFITGQCLVVDGGLSIQEQSGLGFKIGKRAGGQE